MKYVLYRSFGDLDRDVKKHELVAVVTGNCIEDVTDALVKAAVEDLTGLPEYANCHAVAYAPEPVDIHRRVKRYTYEMMGVVEMYPENKLIDFGIIEESEQ